MPSKTNKLQKKYDNLKNKIEALINSEYSDDESNDEYSSNYLQTNIFDDFDLNNTTPISSICIVGDNNNKKNLLINNLLNDYLSNSKNYQLLIISPDNKLNYPKAIRKAYITEKITDSFLEELDDKKNNKTCIVLDNCFSDEISGQNKYVVNLFKYSKIHKIKIILSINTNIDYDIEHKYFDYFFIQANKKRDAQIRLYENYTHFFPSFGIFKRYFDSVTTKQEYFIVDTKVYKHSITNYVFAYDVPDEDSSSEKEELDE